jgi:glycosyltransferase involved in cell wall biosynthesis
MEKLKILVELRPALDGYAGIPQETRLLYSALSSIEGMSIKGLLQTSSTFLPEFSIKERKDMEKNEDIDTFSRLIIAIDTASTKFNVINFFPRRWTALIYAFKFNFSKLSAPILSFDFNPVGFEDFVWRRLFAKSLPAEAFDRVSANNFIIISTPWSVFHMAGLWSKRLFGSACYPLISFPNIDIVIAQTPFPGRLIGSSQLLVRYHDAVPIFLPHTIGNMTKHQANHYQALKQNVANGAYFACVSESSRKDLLRIFPEAESRAVTIENMVSHHYFIESSNADYAKRIIQNRKSSPLESQIAEIIIESNYLLIVSTIEPRKNHEVLLSAWERLKIQHESNIKLVLVGSVGWNSEELLKRLRPWIASGSLTLLSGVPADELRVLYRNAALVICPSVAEGFDYSGVEAMCSGGVVLASDIAVHREIYADAAEYFKAYDVLDLESKLHFLLSKDEASLARIQHLKIKGVQHSQKFRPDQIMPKWRNFLESIIATE